MFCTKQIAMTNIYLHFFTEHSIEKAVEDKFNAREKL